VRLRISLTGISTGEMPLLSPYQQRQISDGNSKHRPQLDLSSQ